MKNIFLIIILFLCNFNDKLNNLENNSTLKKHFSEYEIKILKGLVHSFENEILKNDSLNIIESYKLIYKKLNSFIQNEEKEFIIQDYGIKHEKIFKEIDSSFFKEIWFINYGVRTKDSNKIRIHMDTTRYVGVNISGSKYCDFLIDYAKKDRSIKDYVKGCILFGDLDCPMLPLIFEYFSKLDLRDETIRLVSIIQLLCWLDTVYYSDFDKTKMVQPTTRHIVHASVSGQVCASDQAQCNLITIPHPDRVFGTHHMPNRCTLLKNYRQILTIIRK